MVVDLLGYQHINFTDKETGNIVDGYNLFFPQPITRDGAGVSVTKKFIPADRVFGSLALGSAEIDMQISVSGKPFIQSVKMCSDKK